MEKYHALVIKESLQLPESIHEFNFPIISTKVGSWTIFKIEINGNSLNLAISTLQSQLKTTNPWYIHAYNEFGTKLIVIFKDAVFEMTSDKTTWKEATNYGLDLGIPTEQLDFHPYNFQNEDF